MDDDFGAELERAFADAPRIPGVDWSMALTVNILRVLEERDPGFRQAVKARIEKSAAAMEASDDPEWKEDAPSMRELAESWIFKE